MTKKQLLGSLDKNGKSWVDNQIVSQKELDDLRSYIKDQKTSSKSWAEVQEKLEKTIQEHNRQAREKKKPEQDLHLKELEAKSQLQQKFETHKQDFVKLFGNYSVHNQEAGEMLYHVLLGLLCKKYGKKVRLRNNQEIWPTTHFFWLQQTGSGKDQGTDFFLRLIDKLNDKISEHNREKNTEYEQISYYEMSGTDTPESFLDSYETENGVPILRVKDEEMSEEEGVTILKDADPVPGIFSRYDLVVSRECSFLFNGQPGGSQQSKREILLQLLEGRPVVKTLSGWREEGRQFETRTQFDGCFVGMSRPVSNMKSHLAYSGLQQRGLNLCRKLYPDDRKRMNELVSDMIGKTNKDWERVGSGEDELVLELLGIVEALQKGMMPEVSDVQRTKIKLVIQQNIGGMQERNISEHEDGDHRNILDGFVGRFYHHVGILAVHNALSRKSSKVTVFDYQNALVLLRNTYDHLILWLQENVEQDRARVNRRRARARKLFDIFDRVGSLSRKDLVVELVGSKAAHSEASAYRFVKDWEKSGVLEERDGLLYKL